jgi:hypothetical protein
MPARDLKEKVSQKECSTEQRCEGGRDSQRFPKSAGRAEPVVDAVEVGEAVRDEHHGHKPRPASGPGGS